MEGVCHGNGGLGRLDRPLAPADSAAAHVALVYVRFVPGTGLRAHDYWGDVPQFVTPLAAVLQDVATGPGTMKAADFASKFAER